MIGLTVFGVLFTSSNSGIATYHPSFTFGDFVDHWWIWDTGWYVGISQQGYPFFTNPGITGFFPLYPLLIHIVTVLFPHFEPLQAALVVSNVGTLFGFVAIALLANHDAGDDQAARFTLRALTAYPFALYLFAAYSEGVFLAFAGWALLASRRGWWPVAIITAICAGLTRPFGVVLVLPMFWEFGRHHGWWQRIAWAWKHRRAWRAYLPPLPQVLALPIRQWRTMSLAVLVTFAAPIGIGLYALYCWHMVGDPLAFIHAQQQYNGHNKGGIIAGIMTAVNQWNTTPAWSYVKVRELVDIVPMVMCLVVAICTLGRIPFAYSLYLLGTAYVILSAPSITALFPDVYTGAGRYVAVAIPLFMIVGRWTRSHPWLETLLIQGGWAIQTMLLIFLFHGGWLV